MSESFNFKKGEYLNTENRPISRNISINVNGNKEHGLNLNMLVIGGSGAGKTQFLVRPMLMQQSGSFVITDPKGEILQTCGGMLEESGYTIKVLNLLDLHGMRTSTKYNPFVYIRTETDMLKLINNLMKNTTPPDAQKGEPIWENGEKLLLQALCIYVWLEAEPEEKNFRKVMELLELAEFEEDNNGNKLPSELDQIFDELEQREIQESLRNGKGMRCRHPAVRAYNKIMKGAADTVRSFIVSLNCRLQAVTDDLLDLMDYDEFNFNEIGAGTGYDGITKEAVFIITPDNDDTYNFVVGMFYTQMFQQLYFYADFISGKRQVPIHVTFIFDEFANVALPDDYLKILSTKRSRNMSSIIIVQNKVQMQGRYKERWEEIPGNCDTLLYLGGNEQSTHEYVSKSLGEATYDKDTHSETMGRQGSSSKSYDRYGRKLMTESEVREIPTDECIIFIRGQKPLRDKKIDTFSHPLWYMVANANYKFDAAKKRARRDALSNKQAWLVNNNMFEALKKKEEYDNQILPEEEKQHRFFTFTMDDFMKMDFHNSVDVEEERIFTNEQLQINRNIIEAQQRINKEQTIEGMAGEHLLELMQLRKAGFSLEQCKEFMDLLDSMTVTDIKETFSANMSTEEIKAYVSVL